MIKCHLQQRAFCCSCANIRLQPLRATCDKASKVSQTVRTAHCVDWAKSGEVVFIGRIVAMPGDHIEGREVLLRLKDPPAQLVQDLEGANAVLKVCHWCLKVSWGCQAIRTCAGHLLPYRTKRSPAVR